jgi:hypothetical protein
MNLKERSDILRLPLCVISGVCSASFLQPTVYKEDGEHYSLQNADEENEAVLQESQK